MSRYGLGFLASADGAPVPGNDSFTKALLHMDGLNGGTSFPDVNIGGSANTWTPTNATTVVGTRKYGSASAQLAAGYISTPTKFGLGTSDFTIDCWFNRNGNTGQMALARNYLLSGTSGGWQFNINASNQISGSDYAFNTTGVSVTHATSVTDSLWHHAAYIRHSGSAFVALDGVLSSPVTDTQNVATSDQSTFIGWNFAPFTGFIDEFRISIGIARWTANFTPPTGPYS